MSKKYLLFLFLALFSISTFAQNSEHGRVTEVLDGRTVVISNADKKTTFMLQYIEVPEPEQQLSSVVKEHLEKLVLGKDVKFIFNSAYSKGVIGILFLGDIEINKQMLRDGAAWYDLPSNDNYNSEYKKMESLAKSEKRGVWGINGLKPAWEFREDEYAKQLAAAKEAKAQRAKIQPKVSYPMIPDKIQNGLYIAFEKEVPNGLIVVAAGYLENDKENLVKVVKKPKPGDIVCEGYSLPSPFTNSGNTISNLCPSLRFGRNAFYIEDGIVLAKSAVSDAYNKTLVAYRIYKVSGNGLEFEIKLGEAEKALNTALPLMSESNFKTYLMLSMEVLKDCIIVKNVSSTTYLDGSSADILLAFNDKYGLRDVAKYSLAYEIYKIGVGYMNKATAEATK